jgi:hypothetical protein
MNRILAAIATTAIIVAACGPSSPQRSPETRAEGVDEDLRQELLEMERADQSLRAGMTPERMQDTAFMREMLRTQEAHADRIGQILESSGWPTEVLVGKDGARAAWILVQHGGLSVQRAALDLIQASPASGVSPGDIATLTDRVLLAEGKPQRYGTQFRFEDGNLWQEPVEAPESLDERRAEVGLPPMADYVKIVEEAYGIRTSAEAAAEDTPEQANR